MFKNYLTVSLRNFIRQKLYVAVNVFGLAIGLASCLLIIGYVNNELGFEKMHQNLDRIYRVDGTYGFQESSVSMASIMPAVGPALKEAFPEIDKVVRIRRLWDVPVQFEQNVAVIESKVFAAEPSFLEIFTLPLEKGDIETALMAPFSVVISDEISKTYYPEQNPLGKTIRLKDQYDFQITGVLKKIPVNTQLRSDYVISYTSLEKMGEDVTSWTTLFQDYTYLLLQENADPAGLEQKIPALVKKNLPADNEGEYNLRLQPLRNIYLHSDLSYELPPDGNPTMIYVFSCIAVLILIIASINFVNLTTSRTSHRMKEVGVRKVLGAARGQLVKQFISESVLVTFVAMLLGLVFFELVRPQLEAYLERPLSINVFTDPILIMSMLAMILVVGIFSGGYPALIMSGYQPSEVLRKNISSRSACPIARRILVTFQFFIAISLIAATFGVYKQIHYSLNKDLGFEKENILLINLEDGISYEKSQIIKDELLKNNIVLSASIVNTAPGENRFILHSVRPENKPDGSPAFINGLYGDYDYCATFGIEILQGRNFSEAYPSDMGRSILINEAAVKEFNIENPIGFKFFRGQTDKEFEIIGVVKDFNMHSLKNAIMPCAIMISSDVFRLLAVKLPTNDMAGSISKIKELWNSVLPEKAFEYSFLEDTMKENYKEEQKLSLLFSVFSSLAIVIACLGIFGLSAYMAEKRTKEIGIRKVLGATVTTIVQMLSREFIFLVIIANVIAWPVAYFILNWWLTNFAYRMNISWYIFIGAGVMALFIAVLTVSYQAIRAALANPVESLRQE